MAGSRGFSRAGLEAYRDLPVDDLIGEAPRLLFVGINPGLLTAATNTHFCHPSNRFYPALRQAGLIDWHLDAGVGLTDEQRADLVSRGIGITNLVNRATARADELAPGELTEGAIRLTRLVDETRPPVVAIAGVTAFRVALARPKAVVGEQNEMLAGARLWVIPNPSGLNAHVNTDDMAVWMTELADAAVLR